MRCSVTGAHPGSPHPAHRKVQDVVKFSDLGERFRRGHQHLVRSLRQQREQAAPALGIEFTEHVIEKDDRSDARRVLKVPDLGELAGQYDAALLTSARRSPRSAAVEA